ncbi:SymE family type I addiction module toxin [Lachnospiraceae bacterium 29-91]
MRKEVRRFKVYEHSGNNYKPMPTITLKGLWLEELGFGAGTLLTVRCEEASLFSKKFFKT